MNYLEIYHLSQSKDMQDRTNVGCLKTAQYIQSEPPETVDHDKRVTWANWVMQNPQMPSQQAFVYVCLDTAVQEAGVLATDDQISAAISGALAFLVPLAPGNQTLATMGMISPPPAINPPGVK